MKETIDKGKIIEKIKLILIFIYLNLFYIFGANAEKIKYSEIILLLFLGIETITIVKNRKIKYPKIIIALIAFDFFCFLSQFWAIDAELVIDRAKTLSVLTIFLIYLYNFFVSIDDGTDKLLKIIMYAGIVLAIYVILFYGVTNYFNMLIKGVRAGAEINNVNTLGLQTAISIIICFFYAFYRNKKAYYVLSIIPLIVSLGTGSRKVLILIILGIFMLLIMKKGDKKHIKNMVKKIIAFLSVLIIIIALMRTPIFSKIFERFETMMNSFTGNGKIDSSTIARKNMIRYGLIEFYNNPLIGVGCNNSSYITLKYLGWSTYLHNNFVELLATIGIIGFALYYSIYVYLCYGLVRGLKTRNDFIIISLIIISVILVLDYGVVSYYSKSTYIYLALGLIALERIKRNEKNTELHNTSKENINLSNEQKLV